MDDYFTGRPLAARPAGGLAVPAASTWEPLQPVAAAPGSPAAESSAPHAAASVETVLRGGEITGLQVLCSCGERIAIDLLYEL